MIASTPSPPYYAVVFTALIPEPNTEYNATARRMIALASKQLGFLGIESSARDADGMGITVSYWESEEAVRNWKAHNEHQAAQDRGIQEWYSKYKIRIAKVERDYGTSGIDT